MSVAITGVVATVASAAYSAYSSHQAAGLQNRAANKALDWEERVYNQNRADNEPWMNYGRDALSDLMGPSETRDTPPDKNELARGMVTNKYGQIGEEDLNFFNVMGDMDAAGTLTGVGDAYGKVSIDGKSYTQEEYASLKAKYDAWKTNESTMNSENPYDDLSPEMQAQVDAQYDTEMGIDERTGTGMLQEGPGDYKKTDGYEFRLSEGEKGINRALASRGQYDSGGALKTLAKYNQDYATNERGNWINEWINTRLNPTLSVAGLGQVATSQNATNATNSAGQIASTTLAQGNAAASGYTNTANTFNNAAGNLMYLAGRKA